MVTIIWCICWFHASDHWKTVGEIPRTNELFRVVEKVNIHEMEVIVLSLSFTSFLTLVCLVSITWYIKYCSERSSKKSPKCCTCASHSWSRHTKIVDDQGLLKRFFCQTCLGPFKICEPRWIWIRGTTRLLLTCRKRRYWMMYDWESWWMANLGGDGEYSLIFQRTMIRCGCIC